MADAASAASVNQTVPSGAGITEWIAGGFLETGEGNWSIRRFWD